MAEFIELLTDLYDFLKTRKKYWLAPVIFLLLIIGLILIFAGSSAIGPYIYTLF